MVFQNNPLFVAALFAFADKILNYVPIIFNKSVYFC